MSPPWKQAFIWVTPCESRAPGLPHAACFPEEPASLQKMAILAPWPPSATSPLSPWKFFFSYFKPYPTRRYLSYFSYHFPPTSCRNNVKLPIPFCIARSSLGCLHLANLMLHGLFLGLYSPAHSHICHSCLGDSFLFLSHPLTGSPWTMVWISLVMFLI